MIKYGGWQAGVLRRLDAADYPFSCDGARPI